MLLDSSLAVIRLARAQGGLIRPSALAVSALELRGSIDVDLPVVRSARNGGGYVGAERQNSQNRDSAAIQVKLDELIRVSTAQNSFVGIEHLTDDELEDIRSKCERRAEAEKIGEASVQRTGKKARQAADRVTG